MIFIMFFSDLNKYLCNMSAIIILIVVSLFVAIAFLSAFIWSVRSGQYDDTHTPGIRVLFDDNKPKK